MTPRAKLERVRSLLVFLIGVHVGGFIFTSVVLVKQWQNNGCYCQAP